MRRGNCRCLETDAVWFDAVTDAVRTYGVTNAVGSDRVVRADAVRSGTLTDRGPFPETQRHPRFADPSAFTEGVGSY